MKTAISVPDEVFNSAEQLARRLGKSRSELYSLALNEYIERNSEILVKESLDQIYGGMKAEVDSQLASLQARSLPKGQW